MFKKIKRYWYYLTHPVVGEVLELHSVTEQRSNNESTRRYEITPSFLEQTLLQYQHKGYRFISLLELENMLKTLQFGKRKFIAVTLDDGYMNNFTQALPIFEKLHCPFTIFVATQPTQGILREIMTPVQLKQIAKHPLCTIGCHTVSHIHLSKLTIDSQRKELQEAKQTLETLTGTPVHYFAYPYGDYNQDTITLINELNFHLAFCAWGGGIRKDKHIMGHLLPRVEIRQDK